MNWAGWKTEVTTRVAQMRTRMRPHVTSREGRLAVVGGTLFMAAGVAAFQSPVMADGCDLPQSISLSDVRNASLSVTGEAVDGSIVDVVTSGRGRVVHYVVSYGADGEAGPFIRTVALRPHHVDICTTRTDTKADIQLSKMQLRSMREVIVGMTVTGEAADQVRNVTALYHPAQLSLAALSDWHAAQDGDTVDFRLYPVSDGMRVAAVVDTADAEAAPARPRAFSQIARPDYSLNRVSFAI
jgi:hypothetical protein